MADPDPVVEVEEGPSDLVRFLMMALVVVIIIVATFVLVRARQINNANRRYEDCLSQVQSRENPPGFKPEQVCQKPG